MAENYENPDTITLEFDDGESIECEPIGIFEVDAKEYIALAPVDEEAEDIYIYAYHELGENEFELLDIEDDDLFDKVVAEFEAICDELDAGEEE